MAAKKRGFPSPARAPRLHLVLATLREHGPMSAVDLAEVLQWTPHEVSAVISPTRVNYPGVCLRITRYLPVEGEWKPYVALYAAEGGQDARRPTKRERNRAAQKRYRAKYGAEIRARDRRRRNADRNGPPAPINPWMQLAPRSLRSRMGNVAANTNSIQEAA